MFAVAENFIKSTLLGVNDASSLASFSIALPVEALPEYYSIDQICSYIRASEAPDALSRMVLIEHCVQHPERIVRKGTDNASVQELLRWISNQIRPTGDLIIQVEVDKAPDRKKAIDCLVFLSRSAFRSMQYLHSEILSPGQEMEFIVLLGLVAYTDAEDPWTTEAGQKAAESLLNHYRKQLLTVNFIIDYVLTGFIRPIFSSSKIAAVTSQGRKASNSAPRSKHLLDEMDPSKRPWKFRDVSSMASFRWAIRNMDEDMIYKNWHLCIPPLLTLLDDPSTAIRLRGLQILSEILQKIPARVLHQTGLGEVFEDAIMPTLLFLPSLTPVDESVRLLDAAYPALLSLGNARFSTSEERNKVKFLDRIMHQGVLQGLMHSGDNVRIAELLLQQTTTLIHAMGINAVRYLKDILPILASILTDPFGPSHPSLLLAGVTALQATIANCWPRLSEPVHRLNIVKMIIFCWAALNEDSEGNCHASGLKSIKLQLIVVGTMLVKAVGGHVDMRRELYPLVQADPSLTTVFGFETMASTAVS